MSQHVSNLNRHRSAAATPGTAADSKSPAASHTRSASTATSKSQSTAHLASVSSASNPFRPRQDSPEDTYDFDTAMAVSNAHASTSNHQIDTGYMTDDSDSQATEVDDRDHPDEDFWAPQDGALARPDLFSNDALHHDSDLEELLAWGSGEIELDGMPTAGPSDHRDLWYEDQPDFLDVEIATDDNWSDSESDSSMDSTEEAEQLLAIRSGFASDSDGSLGDGDTTDSLDDTDHDALVRFGIEEAVPTASYKSSSRSKKKNGHRKNASPSASSSSSEHETPLKKRVPLAPEPLLGQFAPQPPHTHAIVIATERALVISPFSIKKIRKLIPSVLNQRSRRGSEASSSYTSTGTISSAPAQPQALDLPSLMLPEGDDQGEIYMELDLDDILEASAIEGDEGFDLYLQESEDATDAESAQVASRSDADDAVAAAFERWNRIPIGAFRRARAESSGALEQMFSPETAVRNGSKDEIYMPFSGTLLTSARSFAALNMHSPARLKGRRLKVSRRDAIALSPILCPVQTTPMPSTIRSRKQRRSDKKQSRKTKSSTSTSARSNQSPTKGSQADEELMLPPSSTVPRGESSSFSSGQISAHMAMAPISPAPFASFGDDGHVPPLDLPEAATLFEL